MINCIVIDDEPLAIEKLENYISKLPELNLLKTFNSGISAIGFLKTNSVDLLFLDIEMKELTGIQLLESVSLNSKVIITSAYKEYAIKGFELKVSDYLLKPITFERFVKAYDKVVEELNQINGNPSHKRVFVKTEYRLEGIETSEILYIEGMGDYRRIVTTQKKIMTLQSFPELAKLLPRELFCRVHKSFIVAVEKIEKIERNRIAINEKLIPISESYNKIFFDKINKS
jgi:DNA-binding LytR/AlgR family response regulator